MSINEERERINAIIKRVIYIVGELQMVYSFGSIEYETLDRVVEMLNNEFTED